LLQRLRLRPASGWYQWLACCLLPPLLRPLRRLGLGLRLCGLSRASFVVFKVVCEGGESKSDVSGQGSADGDYGRTERAPAS
jgi:hypothetical protein